MFNLPILTILLCFLILEIFTSIQLADIIGWWLLAYFLAVALIGLLLLGFGYRAVIDRMSMAFRIRQPYSHMVLHGFIPILASVFLIFPGVISDIIALALFCWFLLLERNSPVFADSEPFEQEVFVLTDPEEPPPVVQRESREFRRERASRHRRAKSHKKPQQDLLE